MKRCRGQIDRAMSIWPQRPSTSQFTHHHLLQPGYASAYGNRALAYHELQQPTKAVADCTTALQLDAKAANVYHTRGRALAALKRYQEAITDYDAALKLNPKHADAHAFRGRA